MGAVAVVRKGRTAPADRSGWAIGGDLGDGQGGVAARVVVGQAVKEGRRSDCWLGREVERWQWWDWVHLPPNKLDGGRVA